MAAHESLNGNQFKQLELYQNIGGKEKFSPDATYAFSTVYGDKHDPPVFSYEKVRDVHDKWEHNEGPMSRKLQESKEHGFHDMTEGHTLHEDIASKGAVIRPIQADSLWHDVGHPMDAHVVINGHHRVASLYDVNPDAYIPVQWNRGMSPNRKEADS